MKELIALRPLTYGTRRMRPGESFSALDSHARLLVAIGRARSRDAVPVPEAAVLHEADGEEPTPKRRRRTYKRRDLRAED